MRISLVEWAERNGITRQRAQQLFDKGRLKTVERATAAVTIEECEQYIRLKRGRKATGAHPTGLSQEKATQI